ncbi:MAG: hypothetical protein RSD04_00735 [Clostridia bacterium]
MAKIIFDIGDDFLSVNGELYLGGFFVTDRSQILAINYMPADGGYIPLLTRLVVADNKVLTSPNLVITNCQGGIFVVNFTVQSYLAFLPPTPYFQTAIQSQNTQHFISAFKQGSWKCSIETQSEIVTFNTFGKLDAIDCKSSNLRNGQLLTLQGEFSDKSKFLKILFYNDDYHDLLQLKCQNVQFDKDGVTGVDFVNDIPNRVITRKLSFVGGEYVEQKRSFEYRREGKIVDQVLPIAFAEGVFCSDFDFCRNLLSYGEKNLDYLAILGDFDEIFLPDFFELPPFRLGLAYYCASGKNIKYFDFGVEKGKIRSITPCKNV